jgi:hypothetical protein
MPPQPPPLTPAAQPPPAFEDLLTPSHWTTSATWSDQAVSDPVIADQPVSAPAAPAPAADGLPDRPALPRRPRPDPAPRWGEAPLPPADYLDAPAATPGALDPSGYGYQAPDPVAYEGFPAQPAPGPVPQPLGMPAPANPTLTVLPQDGGRSGFSLGRFSRQRQVRGRQVPLPEARVATQPHNPYDSPAAPAPVAPQGVPVQGPPPGEAQSAPAPGEREDADRSALASTALSELSMLAAYRPELDDDARPLTRRTPAATPAAAPPPPLSSPTRAPRSAEEVRSTMSGFLTGAAQGRGQGGIASAWRPAPPAGGEQTPATTTEEHR